MLPIIAKRLEEYNIDGLLVIGGFEVCGKLLNTVLFCRMTHWLLQCSCSFSNFLSVFFFSICPCVEFTFFVQLVIDAATTELVAMWSCCGLSWLICCWLPVEIVEVVKIIGL